MQLILYILFYFQMYLSLYVNLAIGFVCLIILCFPFMSYVSVFIPKNSDSLCY